MPNKEKLFANLHKDYQVMINQMCLGFLKGDHDLAADLTQETFINIWSALDKFQGASSYKTWIYRITVNTCLKFIRDNKSKYHISITEQYTKPVPPITQDEDAKNEELYQAIGQLNKVDRLIIMMVLDELEYTEIAEIVGISEGNLRVKIHRIKKNLKTILSHD